MAATVVLVHGSMGGSWTWHHVIKELDRRTIASVAVDLPSCSMRDPAIDFRDDARHVRRLIDDVVGAVVLVGNSYGGYVITEAAIGHPSVRRLVYVAALMLDAGQPITDGLRGNSPELMSSMRFSDAGLIEADAEALVKFGAHLAPEQAKDFVRANAVRPMSFGKDPTAVLSAAAWEQIPSTYVVCTEDRSISPEFQREMATGRATEILDCPWDHWPQHSHPVELADLLEKLASESG